MKTYLILCLAITVTACALYAQAPQPESSTVTVERMVAAASVENREPVGETAAFPAETARVSIWTKITTAVVPVKIKHVYYHEGNRTAEVELTVNSSPYRVWSNKAVRPGRWKVEVVDEMGAVLSTLEFVVESQEPVAPKP